MPKIKPSLRAALSLFMQFRKFVLPPIFVACIGWGGIYIGKVNAYMDKTEELQVILPRVEAKLDENIRKQDLSFAEIGQVNQRLANIEGRLGR